MGKITMRHPQSAVIQQASEDAFERVWKDEGWQLVGRAEPGDEKSGQDGGQDGGQEPKPPSEKAPKPVWVEWATTHGADRAAAEEMTKAALVEAYGQ